MTRQKTLGWAVVLVFATWCGWLAFRFIGLDPNVANANIVSALRAIGAAGIGVCAVIGAGRGVWSRLNPDLFETETAWLHCLVCGLLLWGLLGLGLGCLGLYGPIGSTVVLPILLLGWLIPKRTPPGDTGGAEPTRPKFDIIDAIMVAVVLLIGLIDAMAPPVQTDELYYQLHIPARILESGTLPGGLLQPNGSRPLILHLPFASLLSLGGESAPRVFHLMTSALLLVGVRAIGREHLNPTAGNIAPLVLLSCGSFVGEFGQASNNLPTALCVLVALDAALRSNPRTLAIASAAALTCKYSAAAPIAAVFLVTRIPWKTRVGVGVTALLLVSPWWIRNVLEDLHPLFPFAGWPAPQGASDTTPMQFFFLEKYGAGRDARAMLMLPWNSVMTGSFDTFRFLGRLNPVLLATFPLAFLGIRRPKHGAILFVSVFAFIGWAAGAHWIRHLLPSLPLLALACASGLSLSIASVEAPRRTILGLAWFTGLCGIPSNWGPIVQHGTDRFDVAMGAETREDYLLRTVDGYAAVSWANRHLPEDAKVALLFDWNSFLLDRDSLMGSVEDHVPTRHFLLEHQERSLSALREMGVTHVLTRRIHFLHRLYPFLDDEVFEANFEAPEQRLEDLLLMEATLVYEANRCRVYRLDSD